MSYDAAGNLTYDTYTGTGSRQYDAEGRMTGADGSGYWNRYVYDADGKRTRHVRYNNPEQWYVYGIDGELLAEYAANASPSSPQKEYGYRSGELLISADGTAPTNLAQGRPATQSSTYDSNVTADRAVDGNTSGSHAAGTISHTDYQHQAWWQVDLGSVQPIDTVKVWNRADCCTDQTSNFYVLVSDQPFASADLTTTLTQTGVSNYHVSGEAGAPTRVAVNRAGRYVRIQLGGTNYLTLSEVQVMGSAGGSSTTAGVQWLVSDHLGTPRIILDQTGSLANVKRRDHLPFGEELGAGVGGRTTAQGYSSSSDSVRQGYTGAERDDETGLDFMQARYYSSSQGRFTSVDPYDINMERQLERQFAESDEEADALLTEYIVNPQHWNRYAYVLNNPLKYVDPTGEREEIVARVNIVYDKKTVKTEEAARKLTAKAVADANKVYAAAGIKLEVSYTAGRATGNGSVYVSGLKITEGKVDGAANIFVSANRVNWGGGVSNPNTGESFINYGRRSPGDDIITHELGHQFGINSPRSMLGAVGDYAHNIADDARIDSANSLLRRGTTTESIHQPVRGRNTTHVSQPRPRSRELPAIAVYRNGARRFSPR